MFLKIELAPRLLSQYQQRRYQANGPAWATWYTVIVAGQVICIMCITVIIIIMCVSLIHEGGRERF